MKVDGSALNEIRKEQMDVILGREQRELDEQNALNQKKQEEALKAQEQRETFEKYEAIRNSELDILDVRS